MRELTKFHRLLPGSSFATEILTVDGQQFILKMRGSGNGTRSLLQEFIVNRTGFLLSWPVPNVEPIYIPDNFPWEFGTDEFDDILQKSSGVNLGIHFIPGVRPAINLTGMSRTLKNLLCALDVFFCNYDRTAASRNVLITPDKDYWLVDHGNCLFLNETIANRNYGLGPNHCFSGFSFDLEMKDMLRLLLDFDFKPVIDSIPMDWLNELSLDSDIINKSLESRRRICETLLNEPPTKTYLKQKLG